MKKKVIILALILVMAIGSLISYGESIKVPNIVLDKGSSRFTSEDRETWVREMFEFRREELKNALERGLITEEEAKIWEEHFDYMEKFHEENNFMLFRCGGFGFGRGRGMGFMRGHGFRGSMMRGYF